MKYILLKLIDLMVKILFTVTASPILIIFSISGIITSIISIRDHEFINVFNATLQVIKNALKRIWFNGSYRNVMDSLKKDI